MLSYSLNGILALLQYQRLYRCMISYSVTFK